MAVSSFFKQKDEQLLQKGKFDSPIELIIAAVPTIFAYFSSSSSSQSSARGK
jgi:hypothetical protein